MDEQVQSTRTQHARLKQLETTSLRVRAKQAIRASIITGEIEPSVIYPVSRFALEFGVSATPVREALLDLANEGLIEVVRNRGFRVPHVSDHDLDELFELRILLEVPCVEFVATIISPAQVAECRELVRACERCVEHENLTGFLEFDRQFHLKLLEPLGNSRLLEIVGRLRDQARLYGLAQLVETCQLMASAKEHEEILLAVERSETTKARALMHRHLTHTRGIWAGLDEDKREATSPILRAMGTDDQAS